jgi:hypothetical protein
MNSPFVQRLLAAAPDLWAVYDSHLRNNDELLPYVFMGDVTRTAIARCADGDSDESCTRLLNFLERELSSRDTEAEQLVYLGFCENLLGEARAQGVLVPRMGPLLFKAMKKVGAG